MSDSPATVSPAHNLLSPRLLQAISLLFLTIALAILRGHFEFSGSALIFIILAAMTMGASVLACNDNFDASLITPLLVVSLLISLVRLPMTEILGHNWRALWLAPGYFISILAWLVLVLV